MVQQKYERPYEMVNEAKFIFSCNKMPLFRDKTDGLYRRLEIIEITNRVPVGSRNSNLLSEFTHEDLQYLIWRAYLAINAALVNDRLIETIGCTEALEKFRTQSSTILSFAKKGESTQYTSSLEDLGAKTEFIGHSISKKYNEYLMWCMDAGRNRSSYENFIENVCSELNLTIFKGKFVEKD